MTLAPLGGAAAVAPLSRRRARRRAGALAAGVLLITAALVVPGAPPARAAAGSVTVVATGGAAEGTGWAEAGGVITPTTDVSIDAADLVAKLATGDLTILGTAISVEADVVSATANALVLKSDGDITADPGVRIETAGGDVVLWADAGGTLTDATRTGGGIRLGVDQTRVGGSNPCPATPSPDPVEIVTDGGDIVLSGGAVADVAALRSEGFASFPGSTRFSRACSEYYYAVGVFGADLDARAGAGDGGDIVVRGDALDTSDLIWTVTLGGAYGADTTLRTSGAGTIAVRGDASRTTVDPTPNNSRNPWAVSSGARLTTESGSIEVSGASNVARTNARAMSLGGVVESVSGDITLRDDTASTENANFRGPFLPGTRIGAGDLGASTSDVQVVADRFAFAGTTVATDGEFTLRPNGTSFLDDLTYPATDLTSTAVGALTLGKPGNTSDITIGSAVPTIPGDIVLHGDTLAVNGTLATDATLDLYAAVAATQTAAMTAANLRLSGAGTFTLTNTGNQLGSLAGGTVAAPLGSVAVVDAGGLTLGTLGGDGIVATGPIDIATVEGGIALGVDLVTDDATGDAIVVNAGRSRDVGDTDGGDLIVAGTPTLTTGAGGIVRLYSGSDAASTGLTDLVGGAANARSGVDETSVLDPAPTAGGRYALYRQTAPIGAGGGGSGGGPAADGGSGPALSCTPDPVDAGGRVTCTVTGGPAEADILWTGTAVSELARGPVRTGPDGTGSFAFDVPVAVLGAEVTVELVGWGVVRSLGVATRGLPTAVRAGGGPLADLPLPAGAPVAGVLGVGLAAVVVLRRRVAGRA